MIRATNRGIRGIGFLFLAAAMAAGAGCATASGGRVGGRDVHASARIAGDSAHVLVNGPAWLMHVNIEGRNDMSLFADARKDGTDADCAGSQNGERKRLRPGMSNLVNMSVGAEETICIAPSPNAPTASVMWHARRIDGDAAAGRGQTLAFDGPGR